MQDCLAVILAGGKGSRLEPLTRDRAKPAVPFGGAYRIIDFVLSNCLNSGMRRALVLTQYKAMSLDRHINLGWRGFFCRELGEFIDVVPPQQRIDEHWYQGTADAVYQNIYAIEKERPEFVMILAWRSHLQDELWSHAGRPHQKQRGPDRWRPTRDQRRAREFGVMQVDNEYRIMGFEEKSPHPKTVPGETDICLASMGIYIFSARLLFDQLCEDANKQGSRHDFGRDIIPSMIDRFRVFAFPFLDENRKQDAYWRDVGTLDAYYEANMDLVSIDPLLNMYDDHWPIRTYQPYYPPPKFVFAGKGDEDRIGYAVDSIVCQGSIVSGGKVDHSILSPNVRVNSYAEINDSILLQGVDVGRRAKIRRAIVDKGVCIPPELEIGYDADEDRRRGLTITESGIVVIPKGDSFEHLIHRRRSFPVTSVVTKSS